ncbi:hypothetical protein EDD27_0163 [Nonomuraea polychroma]|uniref:Uncharacterized protein n=1 Tax=Nonomuraea polychroma TaxID=46176 RepID=A0A438LWN8_9ACTN|nr:hypothetical protein [Nonomuraea polychroma]RVX37881.1 hypothetical protein EDD27_0163 [Nonomuraea polychroma]
MGRAPKSGRTRQLGMVFSEHLTYAFDDPQAARFLAGIAEVCGEEDPRPAVVQGGPAREGITCVTQDDHEAARAVAAHGAARRPDARLAPRPLVIAMSDELALGARQALYDVHPDAAYLGGDASLDGRGAGITSVTNPLRDQGRRCARAPHTGSSPGHAARAPAVRLGPRMAFALSAHPVIVRSHNRCPPHP